MIYVAMSGAKEIMLRQTTNNHNLSNLNTTGFKADFDAFVTNTVNGAGHPTRIYTRVAGVGINHAPGSIHTTGRNLDIALDGTGYMAVEDVDGRESYTRAGELTVGPAGILQTADGNPVLGNDGPIAIPPYDRLEIGKDGTISIQPLGETASILLDIDRIKLVTLDPQRVEKTETGLLQIKGDTAERSWTVTISNGKATTTQQLDEDPHHAELPADANASLTSGALEASNVNPIDSLVTMVSLSRQYEMLIKLMKTSEQIDTSATTLLRMG